MGITGFLHLVHRPVFRRTQQNKAVQKINLCPSSGAGWEISALLGPLEGVNLSHWGEWMYTSTHS
jgi:hypothetical protein